MSGCRSIVMSWISSIHLVFGRRAWLHTSAMLVFAGSLLSGYFATFATHTALGTTGVILVGGYLTERRWWSSSASRRGKIHGKSMLRKLMSISFVLAFVTGLFSYDDFSYSGPGAALTSYQNAIRFSSAHLILSYLGAAIAIAHAAMQVGALIARRRSGRLAERQGSRSVV